MKKRTQAFTLVEIALALGIIAFALVAVVGMIPTGLLASRDAVDLTRTSMIAQDAAMRLPTLAYTDSETIPPSNNTASLNVAWLYDQSGHWLGALPSTGGSPPANSFYRVDLARGIPGGNPSVYPAFTDPASAAPSNGYSTRLLAATATITWPTDPGTGLVAAKSNKVIYPLLTRAMP